MANTDAPRGAKPVGHLDGSPWNGVTRLLPILAADGTATFIGDFVKSSGSADAQGRASIAQAAATNALRGVIVGFKPDYSNLALQYRVASTLRYAFVCEAPDVVYEIQEDSVGSTLAITDVGSNGDITVGSGSTTTGLSAMELDSSDVLAQGTSTAQLNVIGLVQREDNELSANATWLVVINEHEHKSTTGT